MAAKQDCGDVATCREPDVQVHWLHVGKSSTNGCLQGLKKLGFWKKVFRFLGYLGFRFLGFLYEDRTRKYDQKNIPYTTHPTHFHGLQHEQLQALL